MWNLLKPLWAFRGFILGSVKREFQFKYRNSMLGIAWTIINPLAMIIIYTVIFFKIMHESFGSADYVDGFTLFDVGGNRYRIATFIHYDKQRMYIRQVMTHAEYDRHDWRKK